MVSSSACRGIQTCVHVVLRQMQLAVIPMPSAKEADVSSFRRNLGVCRRQGKISSEPKVQVIMAMAGIMRAITLYA